MANQTKEPDGLTNKAITKLLFPHGSDDMETKQPDTAKGAIEENEEMEPEPTDTQLLELAIYGKHQEVIHQDSDAMEDQEHVDVHIGTNDYPPSLPSSKSDGYLASDPPSSSSSSSSSDGTHDTNELVAKLSNNE
jgi:hypothetical protein